MLKMAPSLLAADHSRLGEEVKMVEEAGADYLHLDIMDGRFVPNLTFGPAVVAAVRRQSRLVLDVHLMLAEPERFIEPFARAGADIISVHLEVCHHLHRILQQIREAGAKPAVALNPATPLQGLEYILEDVELVLLMSVNPGFGGQKFLPLVLPKLRRLKAMAEASKPGLEIEVDGGIGLENARLVVEAGANVLVAGSSVFGKKDAASALRGLRAAGEGASNV